MGVILFRERRSKMNELEKGARLYIAERMDIPASKKELGFHDIRRDRFYTDSHGRRGLCAPIAMHFLFNESVDAAIDELEQSVISMGYDAKYFRGVKNVERVFYRHGFMGFRVEDTLTLREIRKTLLEYKSIPVAIEINRHIYAIVNGVVMDWRDRGAGDKSRIKSIFVPNLTALFFRFKRGTI